jgi:hypothetical protein
MNGSLDYMWTMIPIFMIFPFSLVPLLLMKFDYIKEGVGASPVDWYMIIPTIVRILLAYIIPFFIKNRTIQTIIFFTISFISIFITNILHRQKTCSLSNKDSSKEKTLDITFENIFKIFINSLYQILYVDFGKIILDMIINFPLIKLTNPIGLAITFVLPIIKNTPVYKLLFKPLVKNLLWVIIYMMSYIVSNMMNNNTSLEKYCMDKISFLFIIIFIIIKIISFYKK